MTKSDGKVNIALSQVIAAIFIVSIFYIVPAAYINYLDLRGDQVVPYTAEALNLRQPQEESGRVAGAVDFNAASTIELPTLPSSSQLQNMDPILIAGGLLAVIGGLTVLYVMLGEAKPKHITPEFDNSSFEQQGLDSWK